MDRQRLAGALTIQEWRRELDDNVVTVLRSEIQDMKEHLENVLRSEVHNLGRLPDEPSGPKLLRGSSIVSPGFCAASVSLGELSRPRRSLRCTVLQDDDDFRTTLRFDPNQPHVVPFDPGSEQSSLLHTDRTNDEGRPRDLKSMGSADNENSFDHGRNRSKTSDKSLEPPRKSFLARKSMSNDPFFRDLSAEDELLPRKRKAMLPMILREQSRKIRDDADYDERESGAGDAISLSDGIEERQQIFMNIVSSTTFNVLSAFAIIINAASIGLETEYMAANWTLQQPRMCSIMDRCCFVFFLFELAVRIMAYRLSLFSTADWKWNALDSIMVGGQLTEELLRVVVYSNNHLVALLRVLRVFRLVRVLRNTEFLAFGGEVRMILLAITNSTSPLVSAMLLLCMLAYCLGVYITQMVTHWKVSSPNAAEEAALRTYFDSLYRSMLTLYQAISGGIDWSTVESPLSQNISPWLSVLLVFYVAFSLMALLNVITSIFLNTAMKDAEDDHKRVLVRLMRSLLEKCDEDNSGTISWEEYKEAVESPQSVQFFKSIDMDPVDALKLFRIIDADDSGELVPDELIYGCMRLQGNAKSIDFAAFLHDYWAFVNLFREHAHRVETELRKLRS